jgi:HEAT repeat protein
MSRLPRIPEIPHGTLFRMERSLEKGSAEERTLVLDQIQRKFLIPAQARGTPDILQRCYRGTRGRLQTCPLVAALILRLRTAGLSFVRVELDREHPRAWAARVLASSLGDIPARLLPWLRGCLVNGNLSSRPALDIFLRHLEDPRKEVRRVAAKTLLNAHVRPVPMGPDLRRFATDSIAEVRLLAKDWMNALFLEFLPAILSRAPRGSAVGQSQAAWMLFQHAEALTSTIPDLVAMGPAPDARLDPLPGMLLRIREACHSILPVLVGQVGSKDVRVSQRATASLIANWKSLSQHRTRLHRYLRSPLAHLRANATQLLPLSGEFSQEIAEQLRTSLSDMEPEVALSAVGVLLHRYDLGAAETAAFADRLSRWERAPATRGASLLARKGIGSPTVLRALLAGLHDADPDIRRTAVQGLAGLRPVPPGVVAKLMRALGDRDINVRMNALWALTPIAPRIRRKEEDIRNLLQSVGSGVSLTAMRRSLRRYCSRSIGG